ncbi:MAG: hypothetical protein U0599_06585 [Vicinamibacteria bacterium]
MADERRPPGPRPPSPAAPSLRARVASLPRVLPRPAAARAASPSPRPPRPAVPPRPWRRLLLWPVGLSAAVTLLRLVGELRGWSADYFSRLPGGGLAIVGIAWLVPVVGLWVGWTLERSGHRPVLAARAAWQPLAALVVAWGVAAALGRLAHTGWTSNLLVWAVASLVAVAAAWLAWPSAAASLVAYAAAVRGLVVIVMALATWRGWGTHYDALPPGFPWMTPLRRFLLVGLLPQMTIWIAFTVAIGVACAAAGWLAARRYDEARSA